MDHKLYNAINYSRLSFLNAKQKNTESVEEFTDRLSSLRDEIEAAGHKLTDEDMILTIISGVLTAFDTTIQCLTVDKKINEVKLEILIQKLISEDKMKNEIRGNSKSSDNDQVFHAKKFNKFKGKSTDFEEKLKKVKCYNCDRLGHYSTSCDLAKKKPYEKNSANVANQDKEYIFNVYSKTNKENVWLLDSGASNHCCYSKEAFQSMKQHTSIIKVGDARELKVMGIGSVQLKIQSECGFVNIIISDVLFVPELSVNLISIGKLAKKGYKILFEKEVCNILLENKIIAKGKCWHDNENLYELKVVKESNRMYAANEINNKWKLWHLRLGHLSIDNMKKVKAQDIEFNKDKLISEFCEECVLGKMTKLPHKTIEKDKSDDHVTIHSDLMGPMRNKSLHGSEYTG
jgi:hypothetical protein